MRIGIIGGGASGIFASIVASKKHDVTILDRNDRIGKKLLATGNGRCNITNVSLKKENYHGDSDFAIKIINRFDNEKTLSFLRDIGILSTTKENGKIYPRSLTAKSVLNVFLEELDKRNVDVITNAFVTKIKKVNDEFLVSTKDRVFKFDAVIVATGGMSMPSSGSDGNGYKLLEELGHKKNKTRPALCQLKLDSNFLKHLSGTKVEGRVTLYRGNDEILSKSGDILFTDYGISGPPILDISRYVDGNGYYIKFSIINDIYDESDLKSFEEYYYSTIYSKDMSLERFLMGIINKKFIHYVLKSLDLDGNMNILDLGEKDSYRLYKILTQSEFKITGNNGYKNSQVTVGGILTSEVNDNLESKLTSGLYIIGEILNVDGDCGGYNLQWAWSSGFTAASSLWWRKYVLFR